MQGADESGERIPSAGPEEAKASAEDRSSTASKLLQLGEDGDDDRSLSAPKRRSSAVKLNDAAATGDVKKVLQLLDLGAPIDYADNFVGRTPLHEAASHDQAEVAAALLERGANPNVEMRNLATPLHLAVRDGHGKVAAILIKNGADIENEDEEQYRPLHYAALHGHADVVRMLLREGADVEALTISLETPLTLAAARNHLDTVNTLVAHGANVAAKTLVGETSLSRAIAMGYRRVARRLRQELIFTGALWRMQEGGKRRLTEVDAASRATELGKDLLAAIRAGSLEQATELVRKGADLHARGQFQMTPLHVAAYEGHQELVSLLLKSGADVEATAEEGWRPLHVAIAQSNETVVSLLLQNGAYVNARRGTSDTPLHTAVASSTPAVVELLLEHGADVSMKTSTGETALAIAISRGVKEHITLLSAFPSSADVSPMDWGPREAVLDPAETLHKLKWSSKRYEQAVREEKAAAKDQAKRDCAALLLKILQFNEAQIEEIAALPLMRDTVSAILRRHRLASLVVLDGLIIVTQIALFLATSWIAQHEGSLARTDFGLLAGLLFCSTYLSVRELGQLTFMAFRGQLTAWWQSVWNWMDLLGALAGFILAAMVLSGEDIRLSPAFRIVASLWVLPLWIQLLGFIRYLSREFATFIMALIKITRDLRSFIVVLAIFVSTFSTMLFLILHPRQDRSFGDDEDEAPFESVPEALLTAYIMFLGEFDRNWFTVPGHEPSRRVADAIFVAFLFVMNVLLLNVLIAIVSSSYGASMERSVALFYAARLELAAELHFIFDANVDEEVHLGLYYDSFTTWELWVHLMRSIGAVKFLGCLNRELGYRIFMFSFIPFALALAPLLALDILTFLLLKLALGRSKNYQEKKRHLKEASDRRRFENKQVVSQLEALKAAIEDEKKSSLLESARLHQEISAMREANAELTGKLNEVLVKLDRLAEKA
eukprot:scaffold846_cov252-Pinguiococcus_pyrenoidosus.AAC.46